MTTIYLDDTGIAVFSYDESTTDGRKAISVEFEVTSEDYHDVTTLLYRGKFHVRVPEKNLSFNGSIVNYATSVTNLYEKGQTGIFSLKLEEGERL